MMNQVKNVKAGLNKRKILIISIVVAVIIILIIVVLAVVLAIFLKLTNNSTQCDSLKENCDDCGISNVTPNARIVGGFEAVPYSWPYQVLIIQTYKTDLTVGSRTITISERFMCGGTIINNQTILTAAHCIMKSSFEYYDSSVGYQNVDVQLNRYYPTYESMFTIYAGLHKRDFTSLSNSQQFSLSKIIIHPNFDESNFLNDIALFIVSKPITFNAKIRSVCLPQQVSYTYPLATPNAWAVGWGSTSEGGSSSDVLNNVRLNIYDSSSCANVMTSFIKNWNGQICSGWFAGGKDTCQGDSGGGLYVLDKSNNNTRYIVAGITSYGEGCGGYGKPGIYTRVSYHLNWIRQNMRV